MYQKLFKGPDKTKALTFKNDFFWPIKEYLDKQNEGEFSRFFC